MESKIETCLDNKGYSINKRTLTIKQLEKLKNELTVTPKILDTGNTENMSFSTYTEDDNYISIPKFYGIKKYGVPKINKLQETKIDIKFTGKLRDYQENLVKLCNDSLTKLGGGLLCVGCGQGKCLAKGTPVLMYDNTLKLVENIKIGDVLMGDDSTPRKVLSLAHGFEEMFDIVDTFSNSKYTVNKSHILSLKLKGDPDFTLNGVKYENKELVLNGIKYKNEDIIDIPLTTYLDLDENLKTKLKGFRVSVNTEEYKNDISNNYFYQDGLNFFCDSKHILQTKEKKQYLISGIIDAFGKIIQHFDPYTKTIYDAISINVKNKNYSNNLIMIARSLGIAVMDYDNTISLYGSELSKLPSKMINNKYNFCPDVLTYDIKVSSIGQGEYYGFTIDGNHRFILGDFSVTHNTVMGLKTIVDLGVKTLVLVHKTFLQDQWIERCSQFTNAKIGIIRQDKVQVEGYDICIGMVQSIVSRDYDPELFKQFTYIIFDEAHRYPSKVFSQAFQKTCPKYILSLSATPERADGLTKVLHWYSGDIIYKQLSKPNTQVIVKVFNYESTDPLFKEKKMYVKGSWMPSNTKMINNLIQIKSRNKHIVNILNSLRKNSERKILVLGGRREHLKEIKDTVDISIQKDIDDGNIMKDEYNTYYYVGGMNKHELAEAAIKGDMLFGTYDMAQEGLDIDKLNTLLLITPKKNVTQALGRVMRRILKTGDLRPLIIDVADDLSIYVKQSAVRLKQYEKNEYKVENYYLKDDKIETYEYFLKNKMNMNDDEVKEFMNDPENYEPYIDKILDLQKVED
jgi:superfamily II DNA or RNA helicase